MSTIVEVMLFVRICGASCMSSFTESATCTYNIKWRNLYVIVMNLSVIDCYALSDSFSLDLSHECPVQCEFSTFVLPVLGSQSEAALLVHFQIPYHHLSVL